jgi:hypothetical protein
MIAGAGLSGPLLSGCQLGGELGPPADVELLEDVAAYAGEPA